MFFCAFLACAMAQAGCGETSPNVAARTDGVKPDGVSTAPTPEKSAAGRQAINARVSADQ
jgi:hypothetical protein